MAVEKSIAQLVETPSEELEIESEESRQLKLERKQDV